MKYPFVLTMVVCVTLLAFNQTPSGSSADQRCTLTPEQAPEIRGIRLGMSAEQLLTAFPGETNRRAITDAVRNSKQPQVFGVGRLELRADGDVPNPRFAGVGYISVELLDERVTSFYIAYSAVWWKSVDQFVAKLSEGLRLPNLPWARRDEFAYLKCNGFNVEAYASKGSGDSFVRVLDTSVSQIVEDRREAEKDKARQAFRP